MPAKCYAKLQAQKLQITIYVSKLDVSYDKFCREKVKKDLFPFIANIKQNFPKLKMGIE